MIKTSDTDVVILEQSTGNANPEDDYVIYSNGKEKWIIKGRCNYCGKCLPDNWVEILPRLDIPVRPEISKIKECSLKGEYL